MRAVFLDRDGVINEDEWPTTEWSKFKLIDGAIEAVRKLNETGMKVIVVTNQPVIARNLCTEKDIENIIENNGNENYKKNKLQFANYELDSTLKHLND